MTGSSQVIVGRKLEFATPDTPYSRFIREVLRLDLADHPAAGTDADQLARLRVIREGNGHGWLANGRSSAVVYRPRVGWLLGLSQYKTPVGTDQGGD